MDDPRPVPEDPGWELETAEAPLWLQLLLALVAAFFLGSFVAVAIMVLKAAG